ncbi:MAG: tetratricopeptide repeat protein [Pseudomonadota bacterium]
MMTSTVSLTRKPASTLRRMCAPAIAGLLAGACVLTMPVPASAQDDNSAARMRKIEAEIRALQRQVFPGGDGTYFEPQIRPNDTTSAPQTGAPSTTALTDVLARLDAIEQQLQRLTGLTEENTNAIAGLSVRVEALETAPTPSAPAELTEVSEDVAGEEEARATDSNLAAMGASQPSETAPTSQTQSQPQTQPAAASGPTPQRLAAVQEITKPQSDDAGDDAYSYGYRLWNAGFYPEARQALSKFVEDYPNHWRTSYGRNLLGRAYLDDGNADDAARWFLRNYQSDRTAARAPDSLLYLAESMIALGDTKRACIALAEFGETYPAVATGRLMDKYQTNRGRVTCDA